MIIFVLFFSLTIITGQQNFSSLADGLLGITPQIKNSYVHSLQYLEAFTLNFATFFKFLKYQFYLFTNKARKLKAAESNQAKDSITKLWLATDKANRSPVV